MLRLISFAFLTLGCLSGQAEKNNGVSTTEIIFTIPHHQGSDGKRQPLTKTEKESTEKRLHRELRNLGLSAQSISWTDQGELKLVLPPLGEAVREDGVSKLTQEKLTRYGYLTLNLLHPESRTLAPQVAADPENEIVPGYKLVQLVNHSDGHITTEHLLIKRRTVIDSSFIKHAQELYGPHEGKIMVELNKKGGEKMLETTRKMQHGRDRIAIILDGKVLSAPVVQSSLSTKFQISGIADAAEAKKLAAALLSPLPNSLRVKSINPPLAK
jgi:preprotein translocase subunit SecD